MRKDTQVIKKTGLVIRIFILSCFAIIQFSPLANAEEGTQFRLIPFESEFVAFRHGSDIGNVSISLRQKSDKQYELIYESDVSRFFFSDKRTEKTLYSASESNLLSPIAYEYQRTGTGPNKNLQVKFDYKQQLATINDDEPVAIDNHIDNQLFRIDISRQLALGEKEFVYNFINYRGEKRRYEIRTLQREELKLPYGRVDSIKVKVARESNKRVTYAWFAPKLNYSLVRLQQFKEDKEQGDIQLKAFTPSTLISN